MTEIAAFVAPLATLNSQQWLGITAASAAAVAVLGMAFTFGWWAARR